jgi:hypothetical protein
MFIADVRVSPLCVSCSNLHLSGVRAAVMVNLALCSLIIVHPSKMEVRAKAARWESFESALDANADPLLTPATFHILMMYSGSLYSI